MVHLLVVKEALVTMRLSLCRPTQWLSSGRFSLQPEGATQKPGLPEP